QYQSCASTTACALSRAPLLPSALGELLHCFPCKALAISSRSVTLHFAQARVTGDGGDHVRAASDLGETARGRLASAVRGNVGTSGFIAAVPEPVTEACRSERFSEARHQERLDAERGRQVDNFA